jgi:hypothetical protein
MAWHLLAHCQQGLVQRWLQALVQALLVVDTDKPPVAAV